MLELMHRHLFTTLWMAWLLYWAIAAANIKAAVRRESAWSRLAHFGPLAVAWWMLGADRLPGGILSRQVWPRSEAAFWAGAAILCAGLAFSVWARHVIGRNWSGSVTVKADHELVQRGPYRLVRHPIYTGLLLGFAGTAIAMAEWRGVVALAIVFAALWRKLRIEEAWMGEVFGARYATYKAEVKALVPFLL